MPMIMENKAMVKTAPAVSRRLTALVLILACCVGPAIAQDDDRAISYDFKLAGDRIAEFTVVGAPTGVNEATAEIARCLANMPAAHRRHIAPVYIVPALPGGRTTGGGFYPKSESDPTNMRVWLGRSDRTGVPDALIEEHLGRSDISGVIAITHDRITARPKLYQYTALHETAHALQAAGLALTAPGVTVASLAQRYPNASLREHAAEAYSRLIVRPNAVCRREALPAGESMRQCTRRVTQLLRSAPAFVDVPAEWAPVADCISATSLDPVDDVDPPPEDDDRDPPPPGGDDILPPPGDDNDRDDDADERPSNDDPSLEAASGLRLIGRDDVWYVFNEAISRRQAIDYFWGGAFEPSADELRALDGELRTEDGHVFELPATHWRVDYTPGFTRREVMTAMRPDIRDSLDDLPDITDWSRIESNARPDWIPVEVWRDMMEKFSGGWEGVATYPLSSPSQTTIVVVIRDGSLGAYAEMIEDRARLYGLYDVAPPGRIEAITGQSSEQAFVRWLAAKNAEYNRLMRRYVNAGLSVREARARYRDEMHMRLAVTFIEAYGAVATGGVTDPAGAVTGIIQNLAAFGEAVSE